MQIDFHYYATYCASIIAGFTHDEAIEIAYSSQFVDCCSKTFIRELDGPLSAVTTQLQLELMESRTDILGLQNITRIWSSFHFLPARLYDDCGKCTKAYKDKYRLICDTNSDLLIDTVELAKGKTLQAFGIAMHILADTWAHRYFAGTPSLVINNTDYCFYEMIENDDGFDEIMIDFRHSPTIPDNPENCQYTNSVYQLNENSIMNLGHGRCGHLPDYSYIKYKYLPSWNKYEYMVKDNPHDYLYAFAQMVYALRYLRGEYEKFETEKYEFDLLKPYTDRIETIIRKRQILASNDWREFGEELSGCTIPDFDMHCYSNEYRTASNTKDTFLGKFFLAAMAQKSMVTSRIFKSRNLTAGFSVDYDKGKFRGVKDFRELINYFDRG